MIACADLPLTFQFQMYIAYGSALYSGKASTNLHIDMSDAVNCLVYVGFPSDGNPQENAKEVFKEVDKAGMFAQHTTYNLRSWLVYRSSY